MRPPIAVIAMLLVSVQAFHGGYGVLTAAGASLDPKGPPTQMLPGGPISVWKGFQRNHAEGLELLALPAASASGH